MLLYTLLQLLLYTTTIYYYTLLYSTMYTTYYLTFLNQASVLLILRPEFLKVQAAALVSDLRVVVFAAGLDGAKPAAKMCRGDTHHLDLLTGGGHTTLRRHGEAHVLTEHLLKLLGRDLSSHRVTLILITTVVKNVANQLLHVVDEHQCSVPVFKSRAHHTVREVHLVGHLLGCKYFSDLLEVEHDFLLLSLF